MEKVLIDVLLPDRGDRSRPDAYPCIVIKNFPGTDKADKVMFMPERTLEAMPYKAQHIYLLDPGGKIGNSDWIYHRHHPDGIHKNEGNADPEEIKNVGWLKVVATSDPVLIKDGILPVSKLFMIEYANLEGNGEIRIDYVIGYAQNNENKPDQEYSSFNKDSKGCAILSIVLKGSYDVITPAEKTEKHLEPVDYAAADILSQMDGELYCQGEVYSETGYTHDQALQLIKKGAEWQEKQYLQAMEEGNITAWMLTIALRRMSPVQMKSLAESLQDRLPIEMKQPRWRKIDQKGHITSDYGVLLTDDNRLKEGVVKRMHELAPTVVTHYIPLSELLLIPKEA